MALCLAISALIALTSGYSHPHYHNHIHHPMFDEPPPPQDQCKPVDAKEPDQCPMTIGPPWYVFIVTSSVIH